MCAHDHLYVCVCQVLIRIIVIIIAFDNIIKIDLLLETFCLNDNDVVATAVVVSSNTNSINVFNIIKNFYPDSVQNLWGG